MEIVVLGSLNMDLTLKVDSLPAEGETISARELSKNSGGKGANQALAAARFGAGVRMVGRVGNDKYADELLSNLHKNNILVDVVKDPGAETGTAFITVDNRGNNTIVVFPGANNRVQPEDLELSTQDWQKVGALISQL